MQRFVFAVIVATMWYLPALRLVEQEMHDAVVSGNGTSLAQFNANLTSSGQHGRSTQRSPRQVGTHHRSHLHQTREPQSVDEVDEFWAEERIR
mmetsp:Transcript_12143/g.33377  ORF Transcript_12143/g.33377 Transcript_12143/m.33377 type:complete len:93 (+) Transcript_12143:39-317(+)